MSPSMPASPSPEQHPAAYPILLDVQVRYGDLGPDGRVSTLALARWFEDARVSVGFPRFSRLVEDGGFGSFRVLLASQLVERIGPVTWQSKIRIGVSVQRIGGSSFTYGYGVFSDDGCVGTGESVTVFATTAGPAQLPDELRADLAGILLDDAGRPGAPRPGDVRRDRSAYPFSIGLRARISDIDTNRHGNNVALVTWYADVVAALHGQVLGTGWGGPPPELAPWSYRVQYVAEVGYPAEYDLALAVTGHDEDTVHYALGLFLGERCVGLADASGARGDLPPAALDALASPAA